MRVSKAAQIAEGYLYRPGCRPVMAAVSCRARAEHLGLAGSCRRGLLMGVQIAGKDMGTGFRGPGRGAGTARQQREAVAVLPR